MQKWKGVKTLVKIVREVYKKADKSTRIENRLLHNEFDRSKRDKSRYTSTLGNRK